jgi:molybdenum cofactor synthesis domain-containing protein
VSGGQGGEAAPTAAVLIIGNEILSGRTQDANLGYLGRELAKLGIRIVEARVVPDIEDEIVRAVNELRAKATYVFTTGGIGPTHDDITSQSIAKAFGVPWTLHPEAHRILLDHYGPEKLNAARLRMAHTPEGASLIDNPVSKAPGVRIGNVYILAGIPAIAQAMFQSLKHELSGGPPLLSVTVTAYAAEGVVATGLEAIQKRHPSLDIGSYPFQQQGRFGTQLVVRGTDAAELAQARDEITGLVKDLGQEFVLEG